MGDGSGMESHRENEVVILSRFIPGDIDLSADPSLGQWNQSFENIVESLWGHDISVRTINNSTHIFFLLTWYDPTNVSVTNNPQTRDNVPGTATKEADGSAIMFERPIDRTLNQEKSNLSIKGEPEEEIKDTWYW